MCVVCSLDCFYIYVKTRFLKRILRNNKGKEQVVWDKYKCLWKFWIYGLHFFKNHISSAVEFTNCSQIVCLLIKSKLAVIVEELEISFLLFIIFRNMQFLLLVCQMGRAKNKKNNKKRKRVSSLKARKCLRKRFDNRTKYLL